MKRLRYDRQADNEFAEAAERYAAEDMAVAARFVESTVAIVAEIRRSPHVWPMEPNVPTRLGVRRRVVPGFPYLVLYKEYATEVVVVAIAHGKREPGYWLQRVPR